MEANLAPAPPCTLAIHCRIVKDCQQGQKYSGNPMKGMIIMFLIIHSTLEENNFKNDILAIYQTLPLVPKSSFFSLDDRKVRVERFHFYLK